MSISSISTQSSTTVSVAEQQKLEQAAQAFEAIFVRNMISSMRKTELANDLFSNSGSDQFRDLMDQQIADDMAQNNGLGIAEMLFDQWVDKL